MNDSFSEIAHRFLKHRIPLLSSLLLVLLFFMPLDAFELNGLHPQISLMCVYYWVEKRPYMFGFISAFLLGLLVDVCSASPLGSNCLLLMVITFILSKAFHYIHPASFSMDWLLFALVCISATFLKWILLAVYFGTFPTLNLIVLNTLSTLMLYPLIAYINNWIQLNLLPQERINE